MVAEPIRIRARARDGVTEVRVLLPHPMESGFRKDGKGRVIPRHHITEVQVSLAERVVLAAKMGPAVSQDPLLAFRFAAGSVGDRIHVTWTDNLGNRRTDVATIA
jgi:sulfur-oxidizing protein SoxZ